MKKYYQNQTEQALKNFPFSLPRTDLGLVYAIVEIKKAAAIANYSAGNLSAEIKEAVVKACEEILTKKFDDQFVTSSIQGGAGTSINMNVNEVIASRSEEISGKKVHPNDHVNMSQSTNDVNPSALKIVSVKLAEKLLKSLDCLIFVFDQKSKEYQNVKKLARTHIQDAVPTTLGAEFESYRDILKRDKRRIENALVYFYELNMGGTAIGNKINASQKYVVEVYKELRKITGINKLIPADNLMSQTSSGSDFCFLSAAVNILCLDISKMASDLKFMASGPRGGIGEISFKELQPGSSIMPGKVNPVIAETMNQVYHLVSGKNLSIHQAAEDGQLELGTMLPIIADSLIAILKTVDTALRLFADLGIKNIIVNHERCLELLERSTAYAALISPHLGYDTTSTVVKEAIKRKKTIREIILEKKLMTSDDLDRLLVLK